MNPRRRRNKPLVTLSLFEIEHERRRMQRARERFCFGAGFAAGILTASLFCLV